MSVKQENHDIVMKHEEEEKKVSDLDTALEEDQVDHILHILSEVYGHVGHTLTISLQTPI